MSEAKYTRGPWEQSDGSVIAKEYGEICRVYVGSAHGCGLHNARLIAAAPDLLEALQGLEQAYCRAGTGLTREERTEDRKRLIAARAAIAKALGTENAN